MILGSHLSPIAQPYCSSALEPIICIDSKTEGKSLKRGRDRQICKQMERDRKREREEKKDDEEDEDKEENKENKEEKATKQP